ncbi:FAD assembly factor SdhE [Candidatus Marithrix sp. Canyon 246]|uniref:FAD assembly factor SdhE n=1 Tax=Candidatus Marithrix sp. Canyon 246 TaxID=1827136 RepID=UPI00084A2236|nr:succinate dehydrogenase assembly factor 2 [Candidatus Marithrix sp. Canyon 246]
MKLKWRCRRGMKELDVLLTQYLEQNYDKASKKQQQAFENLLKLSDYDLYALLILKKIDTISMDNLTQE